MARIIQRPDIGQRMVRGLHLKDRTPVTDSDGRLQPVIVVEDLTQLRDVRERSDFNFFAVFSSQGASVGNFSLVSLVNPLGTGKKILVVDRIIHTIAGQWNMALEAAVGGTTAAIGLDTRLGLINTPAALAQTSTPAAAPGAFFLGPAGLNNLEVNIVLKEGFMLDVFPSAVNLAATVNFFLRIFDDPAK